MLFSFHAIAMIKYSDQKHSEGKGSVDYNFKLSSIIARKIREGAETPGQPCAQSKTKEKINICICLFTCHLPHPLYLHTLQDPILGNSTSQNSLGLPKSIGNQYSLQQTHVEANLIYENIQVRLLLKLAITDM